MIDASTPMTPREAKEFTKLFGQLNERILSALSAAKSMAEAKEPLRMLENLAGYDLPQAKTMYGLALLMQDKPWYDSKKGLLWLKKGADEADGNEEQPEGRRGRRSKGERRPEEDRTGH